MDGLWLVYLAVIADLFSRRVIGWALYDSMRTELALKALEMAKSRTLWGRDGDGTRWGRQNEEAASRSGKMIWTKKLNQEEPLHEKEILYWS